MILQNASRKQARHKNIGRTIHIVPGTRMSMGVFPRGDNEHGDKRMAYCMSCRPRSTFTEVHASRWLDRHIQGGLFSMLCSELVKHAAIMQKMVVWLDGVRILAIVGWVNHCNKDGWDMRYRT